MSHRRNFKFCSISGSEKQMLKMNWKHQKYGSATETLERKGNPPTNHWSNYLNCTLEIKGSFTSKHTHKLASILAEESYNELLIIFDNKSFTSKTVSVPWSLSGEEKVRMNWSNGKDKKDGGMQGGCLWYARRQKALLYVYTQRHAMREQVRPWWYRMSRENQLFSEEHLQS